MQLVVQKCLSWFVFRHGLDVLAVGDSPSNLWSVGTKPRFSSKKKKKASDVSQELSLLYVEEMNKQIQAMLVFTRLPGFW